MQIAAISWAGDSLGQRNVTSGTPTITKLQYLHSPGAFRWENDTQNCTSATFGGPWGSVSL